MLGWKWGLANLGEDKSLLLPVEHDGVDAWGSRTMLDEVDAAPTRPGLVKASKGGMLALFGVDGHPILPWESATTELPSDHLPLTNGVGKIVCAGKAGLIREDGRIALACRYEDVGSLSEGLVAAKQEGRWGYVKLDGKWIVPPRYEEAGAFRNGFAAVRQDGDVGLIDKRGKVRVPFRYADAGYVLNDRFPFADEKDGKRLWGVADLAGNTILPSEYDCVEWIDLEPGTTRYHGKPGWSEF